MESHVGHSMRERSPDKLLECGSASDGWAWIPNQSQRNGASAHGRPWLVRSESKRRDTDLVSTVLETSFGFEIHVQMSCTVGEFGSFMTCGGRKKERAISTQSRTMKWAQKDNRVRQNEEHDERSWCHRHNARNYNVRWKEWERVKRKKKESTRYVFRISGRTPISVEMIQHCPLVNPSSKIKRVPRMRIETRNYRG